ncbi:unnamed protein product [Nezara viridula]|uniref:Uncharacterized protein n=1 Tax=Nezara viridula TaxID=85310 RepID=A0A9P0HCV8_NEZVI|nr:unnamed protein product [Nezara viridula]
MNRTNSRDPQHYNQYQVSSRRYGIDIGDRGSDTLPRCEQIDFTLSLHRRSPAGTVTAQVISIHETYHESPDSEPTSCHDRWIIGNVDCIDLCMREGAREKVVYHDAEITT